MSVMSPDTKFLLERMDSDRRESKQEHAALRSELLEKIDPIEAFRNKILGMAIIGSGVTSIIVAVVSQLILKAMK